MMSLAKNFKQPVEKITPEKIYVKKPSTKGGRFKQTPDEIYGDYSIMTPPPVPPIRKLNSTKSK